ncbi:Uncharacterised protein [Vibrio cholerae]|nr:Uncharacterised protein [Vibrio cholerae]
MITPLRQGNSHLVSPVVPLLVACRIRPRHCIMQ